MNASGSGGHSGSASSLMRRANQDAQRRNHSTVEFEHVLLGLILEEDAGGTSILKQLGVDVEQLRLATEKLLEGLPEGESVSHGRVPFSQAAQNVVLQSVVEGRVHNFVDAEHVLLALLFHEETAAARILSKSGLTLEIAREEVMRMFGRPWS